MIASDLLRRQVYGGQAWRETQRRRVKAMALKRIATSRNLEFDFDEVRTDRVIPLSLAFNNDPFDQKLAIATEDGGVAILNVVDDQGRRKTTPKHHFMAHNNAVFDAAWLSGDGGLLTSSGDHTIRLWDAQSFQFIATYSGHASSVKSVQPFKCNPNLFVTSSRDGSVRVWDTRDPSKQESEGGRNGPAGEPCVSSRVSLNHIHLHNVTGKKRPRTRLRGKESPHSVTSCLVSHDDRLIVTGGAMDGDIKFWDIRSCLKLNHNGTTQKYRAPKPVHSIMNPKTSQSKQRYGVTSLSLDPSGTLLLASYRNSNLQVYQWTHTQASGTGVATMSYRHSPVGRRQETPAASGTGANFGCDSFYIKASFSPDGNYIASGSCDNNAYVWNTYGDGEPVAILQGHSQEVSAVKWSNNVLPELATASDDGTVKLWSIDCSTNGDQVTSAYGVAKMIDRPKTCKVVSTRERSLPPRKRFSKLPVEEHLQRTTVVQPRILEEIAKQAESAKNLKSYFAPKPKPRSLPKTTLLDFYQRKQKKTLRIKL